MKDFLPIVEHMHLMDYDGKNRHSIGYRPLGKGEVDIPAILDLIEHKKLRGMVMAEMDNGGKTSIAPLDLVKISKAYLDRQGITFRS